MSHTARPFNADGTPNLQARCAENNPNSPENIKQAKNDRGMKKILGLISRFKK